MQRTQSPLTQEVPKWAGGESYCVLAILILLPNICFWSLLQLGCCGDKHPGLLRCPPLCSCSSLPHCFSLPLSASQPFILLRYLAHGKSSFHTFLPHCHGKLASYTSLLTSSSGHHKPHPSRAALFSPPASALLVLKTGTATSPRFLLVFSLLLSILLPLLISGWAHSLQHSASARVTLRKSILQGVMEPESPCGFIKQQLDKFTDKQVPQGHTHRDRDPLLAQQGSEPKLGRLGESSGLHHCTLPSSLSSFLEAHF